MSAMVNVDGCWKRVTRNNQVGTKTALRWEQMDGMLKQKERGRQSKKKSETLQEGRGGKRGMAMPAVTYTQPTKAGTKETSGAAD
jgi:hypothetical protein